MAVSENGWKPQIIQFNRVFPLFSPSILGETPLFLEFHPYKSWNVDVPLVKKMPFFSTEKFVVISHSFQMSLPKAWGNDLTLRCTMGALSWGYPRNGDDTTQDAGWRSMVQNTNWIYGNRFFYIWKWDLECRRLFQGTIGCTPARGAPWYLAGVLGCDSCGFWLITHFHTDYIGLI